MVSSDSLLYSIASHNSRQRHHHLQNMAALAEQKPFDAESLLGTTLTTKNGNRPTNEVLKGKKYLAIYFSAHWCPPCRQFTPLLAEVYDTVKANDDDDLEVVFVSSDRSKGEFDEYYGSHPWTAVPFEARGVKSELSATFGVSGIPTLVVVSLADGMVKDAGARSTVMKYKGDTVGLLKYWDGCAGAAVGKRPGAEFATGCAVM